MNKILGMFFALCISLFSTIQADFEMNSDLVKKLKKNNIRLVVLCNFHSTNNLLNIVTSTRSPGYELTSTGLATLNDTIPLLETQNITAIYASPVFRAQQSTNLLGKAFGLAVNKLIPDARLGAQHFGTLEGEDFDVYKTLFTSEEDMLKNTPPGGEPGISVFNRAQAFLSDVARFQDQTILVITQGFNYCHISKCLTGQFNQIPAPGTYIIYDFNQQ